MKRISFVSCAVVLSGLIFQQGMLCAATTDNQKTTQQTSPSSNPAMMDEKIVITPGANPTITNGVEMFVDADFIYWTARQDGIPYAFTGALGNSTNPVPVNPLLGASGYQLPEGKSYFVDGKMDPGFKVGLGADMRHDGWDLYLEYTWFHNHGSGSHTTTDYATDKIFPTFGISQASGFNIVTNDYILQSSGSWKLRFNNFDLSLGRNFFVSPRLVTRPHFGLKGTWQRQNLSAKYQDIIAFGTALTSITHEGYYNVSFNQFYWGIGIRTGLDTSWQFTPSWSIYGDWALSALWGKFSTTRVDTFSSTLLSTTPTLNSQAINQKTSFHTVSAVLELALGLRWDYWFSAERYRFRIQAGWEEQIWFDQKQINTTVDLGINSNSNLVLQGLTVKFRFDF